MTAEATPEESAALFRIVKGSPDAEQLAALTSVLLNLAAADQDLRAAQEAGQESALRYTRSGRVRGLPAPGPGAWRRSAWF
ncbi:acyl-CoA carboxylase subunit epsilon [Acaricomes phytoseiuli]|uniref:acyl-CoA carboxylase subunit epsilon n=1 Tax=Acaricomes phytoseiuli TaxID=291968 RepID=UPI00037DC968|nr:acyl-CoA carboxylase subunit epsilon [Acaricomes phytoseiuli]MCW1250345.1 acyl-CoA carboxylase subunit epsilon [Acaricomes phytoseiuli]